MTKILLDTPIDQHFKIGDDKNGLLIMAHYECQYWEVNVRVSCGIADMDESLVWRLIRVYEAIAEHLELLQSKLDILRKYQPPYGEDGGYVEHYANGAWTPFHTLTGINDDGTISLLGIADPVNPLLVRI